MSYDNGLLAGLAFELEILTCSGGVQVSSGSSRTSRISSV